MNFNKLIAKLLKEANFGRKEFYHGADKTHIQSFIAGIKPELAGTNFQGAGKEQGQGFYVFRSKQRALKYVTSTGSEFIKDPIIVVIDEELNTDSFDIDYEAEYQLAQQFIAKHVDEFTSNPKYGLKQSPVLKQLGNVLIYMGNKCSGFPLTKPYNTSADDAIGRQMAEYLFHFFERVKAINPDLYNEFEDEVVDKAIVLKYNGERTIFPARIEDTQGNVLWQKSQQQ